MNKQVLKELREGLIDEMHALGYGPNTFQYRMVLGIPKYCEDIDTVDMVINKLAAKLGNSPEIVSSYFATIAEKINNLEIDDKVGYAFTWGSKPKYTFEWLKPGHKLGYAFTWLTKDGTAVTKRKITKDDFINRILSIMSAQ